LKLKRKYNNIIAALMLALYAFVTTPVSYWHHHNRSCDKNETEQHLQMVKKASFAPNDNCKICAHHYSIATNDAITIYFLSVNHFTFCDTFFQINALTNPGYSQSNKGPPAIA
jgi:predicted glycosyltransferase involved in capsule biosynthesis